MSDKRSFHMYTTITPLVYLRLTIRTIKLNAIFNVIILIILSIIYIIYFINLFLIFAFLKNYG